MAGYAEDSGEGRWTVEEAVANGIPAPVITAALYARFVSRQEDSPAMKMVAALRNQFGGHSVRASDEVSSHGTSPTASQDEAASQDPAVPPAVDETGSPE